MYLSLLIAFLGLLVGCHAGKHDKARQASAHQVVRVNIQGDPSTLHPHKGVDMKCHLLQRAMYEGLTRMGLDLKPHLAAAKSVEISEDKKTYLFTLRPLKWSNGEVVTAYDFEKTWKAAVDKNSHCVRADLFYMIKNAKKAKQGKVPLDQVGILALSSDQLLIELEYPSPFFLEIVATPLFSPVHQSWQEGKIPPSNGPFVIESWEHDHKICLVPNPHYWDLEAVHLSCIEISCVNDPNTALMLFEKGEIDWAGSPFGQLPFDALPRFKKQGILQTQITSGSFWFNINTQVPPLKSAKVRKALAIATNREEIVKNIYFGKPLLYSPLPKKIALNPEEVIGWSFNPQKARKLFLEGLKEQNLTIDSLPPLVFNYSDVAGQKQLAEAIQQNWYEVLGIEVELECSEWNIFFSKLIESQYQILGCIWFAAYNDSHYILDFFKDLKTAYNSTGWEDLRYKKLIKKARSEPSKEQREHFLLEAEKILMDAMPIIPLYNEEFFYVKKENLKGVVVTDSGRVDFKWAYFE